MFGLETLQNTNNTDMSITLRAANCDIHINEQINYLTEMTWAGDGVRW